MTLVGDDPTLAVRLRRLARRAASAVAGGTRAVAAAIATPLVPADFLDLIDPMRKSADLRGRVVEVRPETRSATTVTIRPGRGWRAHRPGQYTRIGFDVDGVRLWRAYSLTSRPGNSELTITIRAIDRGVVSNFVRSGLKPGDLVMLDQPTGDFVLPEALPAKALFITGGSGITPVIGMLRHHRLSDAIVIHTAPHAADMLFRDELRAMHSAGQIQFIEITNEPGNQRLQVPRIEQLVPDWRDRETWACGPIGLLDDAEEHWAVAGRADRLHTERFRTHLVAVGDGGAVTFAPTDVVVAADATTPLLDVGEGAGLIMPSGCRMGICFNCVLPLTQGAVRDLRTGELTQTSDDPPLIQTCVSAAAGPCRIDLEGKK